MWTYLLENLDYMPRRVFAMVGGVAIALLAFGMYLQHVQGLEPCPMCIVQRYALMGVAIWSLLAATSRYRWAYLVGSMLMLVTAGFGAFVAARQSWLQIYPPEVLTCGRDFYGMIESFPLKRALPMIFRGGGDCTTVDWTFLGGSIANWSLVCFCIFAVVSVTLLVRQIRRNPQ